MKAPAFSLRTHHPIACDSIDHLQPRGTKNDNSTSADFNRRLFSLFLASAPRVLDLGCAGGGFAQSIWNDGGTAVGVDGSDYSKRRARAAWAESDYLFTADLGRPFLVQSPANIGEVAHFDAVTAWEVLEHLDEEALEAMMVNVHAHTYAGSLFIASISSAPDLFDGYDYHATVQPPEWWERFICTRGWILRPDLVRHFDPSWVRGPNTEGPSSTAFVFEKL